MAVIVTLPALIPFTTPLTSTVAISSSLVSQVILSTAPTGSNVTSNWTSSPFNNVSTFWLIVIESAYNGVTLTFLVAVNPLPKFTVIVASPSDIAISSPFWFTETIAWLLDFHKPFGIFVAFDGVYTKPKVALWPTLISNTSEPFSISTPVSVTPTLTVHVAVLPASFASIIAVPAPTAVTIPSSTVATVGFNDVQIVPFISSTVASIGFFVTINLSVEVSPNSKAISVIFNEIELSSHVTSTSVVAVSPAAVAVIVADPTESAVIFPVSSTFTTFGSLDIQATVVSSVVFSGSTVATNWSVSPLFITKLVLFTTKVEALISGTVTVILSVFPFTEVAIISAVPGVIAKIVPLWIATTSGFVDLHIIVLDSVKTSGKKSTFKTSVCPFNSSIFLSTIFSFFISIDCKWALTITSVVAVNVPTVAVIVVVPWALPVTNPFSSTVATSGFAEIQTVGFLSVVSTGSLTTVNCSCWSISISISDLSIVIPFNGASTVTSTLSVYVPHETLIWVEPAPTAVTNPLWSTLAIL